MTSGPVVVQVLEGENAVLANRDHGRNKPADAADGTIRKDFAESIGNSGMVQTAGKCRH